jgi:hypothetical protein
MEESVPGNDGIAKGGETIEPAEIARAGASLAEPPVDRSVAIDHDHIGCPAVCYCDSSARKDSRAAYAMKFEITGREERLPKPNQRNICLRS